MYVCVRGMGREEKEEERRRIPGGLTFVDTFNVLIFGWFYTISKSWTFCFFGVCSLVKLLSLSF